MLEFWTVRLALIALPLVLYLIWRRYHVARGREFGSMPWGWLIGAGALLAAASMMLTVAFHKDNTGRAYVPAQTQSDGSVRPGYFK